MEPELIHVAGEAANQGGCVLCNSPDFLRGGFGDRTMIICDQCEREFHIGCLAEHGRAKLTELPDGAPTLAHTLPFPHTLEAFQEQKLLSIAGCHDDHFRP